MWTESFKKVETGHPMHQIGDVLRDQGIVVIDNVTSLPTYGEPYTSECLVIGLCHRGFVEAEYDMHPVRFSAKQVSVLFPNHMLTGRKSSPDYLATIVVMSHGAYESLRTRASYRHHIDYQRSPAFQLTDMQYTTISELLAVLRDVGRIDSLSRPAMLANLVEVLSQLLDEFRFHQDGEVETYLKTKGDKLFMRYYDAIVKYHARTREVAFYSSLFNLTPKYFSTLIKRETGRAAGDWISSYIVLRAKSLLRSRADLNVQQVGLMLGFTDQAAFSRYFKNNTGLSPKEYRENPERGLKDLKPGETKD